MIGKTISHYPPKADPPLAGKILEKLHQKDGGQARQKDGGQVGEGGNLSRG